MAYPLLYGSRGLQGSFGNTPQDSLVGGPSLGRKGLDQAGYSQLDQSRPLRVRELDYELRCHSARNTLKHTRSALIPQGKRQ